MTPRLFIKHLPVSELEAVANLITWSDENPVKQTLSENDALIIFIVALRAGQSVDIAPESGDAMLQVLTGELVVHRTAAQQTLETGHVVILSAQSPHALRAQADTKALLTTIRQPGRFAFVEDE